MCRYLCLLTLIACGKSAVATTNPSDLAPSGATTVNGPVDGISCETSEQVVFHIHAHLAIFSGGSEKLVPSGVGIGPPLVIKNDFVVGGSCFSWLHTHDATGVIHIESPVERVYTLGDFFDVWGQPLTDTGVGPVSGAVTAYVNGDLFTADPRTIPLNAHSVIQLDVGTPLVAPQSYSFAERL